MITIDSLTYKYHHGATALSDISTTIGPGIHLLMGENGAGKTTLLHLLAGLRTPSSGSITCDGENPCERDTDFLSSSFLLEENMQFPARTINRWAKLHGCFYPGFNPDILEANLRELGLTGDEPLDRLSLGLSKKSRLAYALSLGVKTLMLDEPTNGIDINARRSMRNIIARSMTDDSTVIIATHSVLDFETLFDNVILLYRSHLVLNMTTFEIGERLSFSQSPIPAYKPLYQELEDGYYRSIHPNDGTEDTHVSLSLLYRSLQSPNRSQIINTLCNG